MKFITYKNIVVSIFKKIQQYKYVIRKDINIDILNANNIKYHFYNEDMMGVKENLDVVTLHRRIMFMEDVEDELKLISIENEMVKNTLMLFEDYIYSNNEIKEEHKDIFVNFIHQKYLKIKNI